MKKIYETPEIKIVLLDSEDVLKVSGETNFDTDYELPMIPLP